MVTTNPQGRMGKNIITEDTINLDSLNKEDSHIGSPGHSLATPDWLQ